MSFEIENIIDDAVNPGENHRLRFLFDLKIDELRVSETTALEMMGLRSRTLNGILDGTLKQLDFLSLIKLAKFLGISDEKCFRLYLNEVNNNYGAEIDEVERNKFLIEHFDLPNLKKAKFLNSIKDYVEIEKRIVEFFELETLYNYKPIDLSITYSQTNRNKSEKNVSFWVDSAFRNAIKLNNPFKYERDKVLNFLPKLRMKSIREVDGLREAAKELFAMGVTLIFQPSLPLLQVKGAAFAVKNKPCIVISNFNKNVALIWISLIHELHHILFDWEDILLNKALVSEENDNSDIEEEANMFSYEFFVPKDTQEVIATNFNDIFLMKRMATRYNVHESILLTAYGLMNNIKNSDYWIATQKALPKFNLVSTAIFLNDWERMKNVTTNTDKLKENLLAKIGNYG